MSWFSEVLRKLSVWWKKNNSIGDVIHNNEALVKSSVETFVDYGWGKKGDIEAIAYECAENLLEKVLKPLPDMAEVIISAFVLPRIASFFKSAFTLRNIDTKEQAVAYIMTKLKGLK